MEIEAADMIGPICRGLYAAGEILFKVISTVVSTLIFDVIPAIAIFIGTPTLWFLQTGISLILQVASIILYPFVVFFRMTTWPIRVGIAIFIELEPLFSWLGNAVLIGITAGGFVTLLTMVLMNILESVLAKLGFYREPQDAENRHAADTTDDNHYNYDYNYDYSHTQNGRPKERNGGDHIIFREPDYRNGSSRKRGYHSGGPMGPPTMARRRMAPMGPVMAPRGAPMLVRRRTPPPGVFVDETIHEEEDSD